jgi:hypothetical protein
MKMYFEQDDTRTLNEIYKAHGIDPSDRTICLALEGGKRIPIPRKYDNVSFAIAFKEMASILEEQDIFILSTSTSKIPKNFVHHYEAYPRSLADSLEKAYGVGIKTQVRFEAACAEGNCDTVKSLLKDCRVDPAHDNNFALRCACENGHIDIVKILLADNRLKPEGKESLSIQYARENDHDEIVRLLENHFLPGRKIIDGDNPNTVSPSLLLRIASFFDVVPLLAAVVPIIGWAYLGARVANGLERLTNQRYSFFSSDETCTEYAETGLNYNVKPLK